MQTSDIKYATHYLPIPLIKQVSKINSRVFPIYNGPSYHIFNYDKRLLELEGDDVATQYRSVIYSYPEQNLLSFSPPKSIAIAEFSEKYPLYRYHSRDGFSGPILVTEIVEGLLVHLFYDDRIHSWEIATKGAVGGKIRPVCSIYKYMAQIAQDGENGKLNPTIYGMFLDALRYPQKIPLKDVTLLDNFDKHYSYTFVLQHPKNTIILPIEYPSLYLVAVYDIYNLLLGPCAVSIPQNVFQEWDSFKNIPIYFPKIYDITEFGSYNEIKSYFGSSVFNTYRKVGINIINTETGDRCQIKNSVYQEMMKLRSLNGLSFFQYLCLKRIQKDEIYVKYNINSDDEFIYYFKLLRNFIQDIHSAYMERYIKQTTTQISPKLNNIIDRIHKEIRIPSLSNRPGVEKIKITYDVVYQYILKLDPIEIFYLITYDKRDHSGDV